MRGRHFRGFLAVLGFTALVWLAMAMSETNEYSLPVNISFSGFDAKRYAVVSADTAITLQVESSGFNIFLLSLKKVAPTFVFDVRNESVRRHTRQRGNVDDLCFSVALSDLTSLLSDLFSSSGVRAVGSARDSLQLVLNERDSKVFHPDLNKLRINFSDGYGLYGEPMVSPTEVTLYGPPEVLAAIDGVGVKPTQLDNVRETGSFRVPLDCSWKALGDVYSSAEVLTVNIPVKRYVEREFSIPVIIDESGNDENLRLYPDRVVLRAWVAQDDVATISSDRFVVSANRDDIKSGAQKLKLSLRRFPRNVRIRSMEPEEIEYVIIK